MTYFDNAAERDAFVKETIDFRRDLHRYPETRFCEYRTTVKIVEALERLGLRVSFGKRVHDVHSFIEDPTAEELSQAETWAANMTGRSDLIKEMRGGYTGCVGYIETGRPGPTVAIRMDIDALEVTETTDGDHLPVQEGFRSELEGRMHACGHDGHAAIGVATAKLLMKKRDVLCGTIKLIFQPAEEGVRGAKSMVAGGVMDDVDYLIGGHINVAGLKPGQVAMSTNGFFACNSYRVEFHGRGSHSSGNPEYGRNALLAACTACLNIAAMPRHSAGKTRVNVGPMSAGTAPNVVADYATTMVEVRGETQEICDFLSDGVERICSAAAAMYGCTYERTLCCSVCCAFCDDDYARFASDAAMQAEGVTETLFDVPFGAGDDIVYMMQRVQSHGGKAIEMGFGSEVAAPLHNQKYDFGESVLPRAAEVCANIAIKTLTVPFEK